MPRPSTSAIGQAMPSSTLAVPSGRPNAPWIAASATIGLPQLQAAFQNIYETMDAIDAFKVEALDNMAATIGVLESEVGKSREYLDRVVKSDQRTRTGTLDLGGGQRI